MCPHRTQFREQRLLSCLLKGDRHLETLPRVTHQVAQPECELVFLQSLLPAIQSPCRCPSSCFKPPQRLFRWSLLSCQPPTKAPHSHFCSSLFSLLRKACLSIPVVGGRGVPKRPSVCCPQSSWFLKPSSSRKCPLASQGLAESS